QQTIEAYTPCIVLTEAPSQIDTKGEIGGTGICRGQARQRHIVGALAHDIDAATDTATGSDAVDQCSRTFQNFDALNQLSRHVALRNQAIQSIETDIGGADGKTPDLESVIKTGAAG